MKHCVDPMTGPLHTSARQGRVARLDRGNGCDSVDLDVSHPEGIEGSVRTGLRKQFICWLFGGFRINPSLLYC
jgi:hypothetical protein